MMIVNKKPDRLENEDEHQGHKRTDKIKEEPL